MATINGTSSNACSVCGSETTWAPIWGTRVCRACVDRAFEEAERQGMPERASGNDTHALPPDPCRACTINPCDDATAHACTR